MNTSTMSNTDLLAALVGYDLAEALAKKPLGEIFGFFKPVQQCCGEDLMPYVVHPALAAAKELAARCGEDDMKQTPFELSSPSSVRSFLSSRIGHLEHEAFWCLWLDCGHKLIAAEELFRGTISQTSVYPREVVKRALAVNAGAVLFAHNHPSGRAEPSRSDELLTNTLKASLALVDVRVLDHFIVSGTSITSSAERGLL